MPHLPQPARARGSAINRVVRRSTKAALPEVQAPEMKAMVRDAGHTSEVEMLASPVSEN